MNKKQIYVTTIETTWELRGDVTPEQINDRIRRAVHCLMLTDEDDDGNYAFRGEEKDLIINTEVKK
jgi:hypothetical protein